MPDYIIKEETLTDIADSIKAKTGQESIKVSEMAATINNISSGGMEKAIYDPQDKAQDIFAYTDDAIANSGFATTGEAKSYADEARYEANVYTQGVRDDLTEYLNQQVSSVRNTAQNAASTAQTAITTANEALPKSGGTVTGDLYLNGDPTSNYQAATKKYVDEQIAAIPTPDASGQIATHNTDTAAHSDIRNAIPVITAGTTDLTAGTSPLATGAIYLVYE